MVGWLAAKPSAAADELVATPVWAVGRLAAEAVGRLAARLVGAVGRLAPNSAPADSWLTTNAGVASLDDWRFEPRAQASPPAVLNMDFSGPSCPLF